MNLELDYLLAMARIAAKGKRRCPEVAAFMLDPIPKLLALRDELNEQTYHPAMARPFVIHEPKRRLIASVPFRDRVVQHILMHHSMPAFERWFAPQSYACRVGKGTHRALYRAVDLHRVFPWVLRIDIAKFFPSIDHQILLSIVLPRTPRQWHWLAKRILRAGGPCESASFYFPGDELTTPFERPHGLPIGNLTSQIWANAMLTPVDHMLASKLGMGTFVRYCDDILLYAHDRHRLEQVWSAIRDRCDTLRLRLHPRKCRLHRTTESVAFLGFVLTRRGKGVAIRLRSDNVRRFRKRMHRGFEEMRGNRLEPSELMARIRAWIAHGSHGHTARLRRDIVGEMKFCTNHVRLV
jgi:retron-type reverse transcriptase